MLEVPVTSVLTLEKIATIAIERGPQPICGIGSGRGRALGLDQPGRSRFDSNGVRVVFEAFERRNNALTA